MIGYRKFQSSAAPRSSSLYWAQVKQQTNEQPVMSCNTQEEAVAAIAQWGLNQKRAFARKMRDITLYKGEQE